MAGLLGAPRRHRRGIEEQHDRAVGEQAGQAAPSAGLIGQFELGNLVTTFHGEHATPTPVIVPPWWAWAHRSLGNDPKIVGALMSLRERLPPKRISTRSCPTVAPGFGRPRHGRSPTRRATAVTSIEVVNRCWPTVDGAVAWLSEPTDEGPFGELVQSPGLAAARPGLWGQWVPYGSLGNIPVRFPVSTPTDAGDVYGLHPFTAHGADVHRGHVPRSWRSHRSC